MVRRFFLLFTLLASLSAAIAQRTKPATQKTPVVQKFKAPIVKTTWGKYSDSSTVTVDEGLALLRTPLTISDDKTSYGISTYQFLYRKRTVTEDEETGKVTPTTTTMIHLFKSTPLPEDWINTISYQLRSGEELYFFDVLAKDGQGHIFFAPTLKVKIK